MKKTQTTNANSKSFVMAYDALKGRTTLFREMASEYDCSIGKFLADVIYSLLDSVYTPVYPDEKLFDKKIRLDLAKNLQAMLKEPQDTTGHFQIRPELVEYFNEIKNHSRSAVGFVGLRDDEFHTLCDVVQVVRYYENGELYSRLFSVKILDEVIPEQL
jgi:hypothetical protein